MRARTHLVYGLVAACYVAVISGMSSVPDDKYRRHDPAVLVLSNLAHAPIFAGLAYLVLKTMAGPRAATRDHYVAAFAIAATLAVLDEWHQSFVPGRSASATDLLLDLAGITSALALVRLRTHAARRRCEAE